MVHILELLDTEAPSGNAIFLIETESASVLGGNRQANDMFAQRPNDFNLKKILKNAYSVHYLIELAEELLAEQDIATLKNIEIITLKDEIFSCNLDLLYATENQEGLLIIVKIQEDRRPHYLKLLLDKNNRPAFLLHCGDDLIVRGGNDLFYKSFACTRENIQEKYQNRFELFLSEEERLNYVAHIYNTLQQESHGILNVPLRTARGEVLYFYFSKKAIKHLVEDTSVFCLLVGQNETLEQVECPYDRPAN